MRHEARMRGRRGWLWLLVAGSLLIMASCGGGGPTPRVVRAGPTVPPLVVDPCSLVTGDEAETVLDAPVDEPVAYDDTSCSYVAQDGDEQEMLDVVIRRGEVAGDTAHGFDE